MNANAFNQAAKDFNDGADARLAGRPRSSNPHRGDGDGIARFDWYRGWDDVERNWGAQAQGRRIQPLPEVQHAA